MAIFFGLLFTTVLFLFRNAFSINFFSDDYFFLKIGRADSLKAFLGFFSPVKNYFYRPFATEFFYYVIHLFEDNLFVAHAIVFLFYFLGLLFLFKSTLFLTKNKGLSYLTTALYGISFIHVFQLYYLGTFQEVAMFSSLSISLYLFLKNKYFLSLLAFVIALLSKETALFFVILLILISIIFRKNLSSKKIIKIFPAYIVLAFIFIFLYRQGLASTIQVNNYKLQTNLRMFFNNVMWYLLWSLGVPNFTSDYFISIFRPPIREFYKLLKNFPEVKTYFILLFSYWIIFILSTIAYLVKNKNKIYSFTRVLLLCLAGFLIFTIPFGLISQRWMVRLTIPLVFITAFQAYVIFHLAKEKGFFRFISLLILVFYIFLNWMAIPIHESSSTFLFESKISANLASIINKNKTAIYKNKYIYFKDVQEKDFNPWGQSKHLKTTLGDQNFLDLYFPGRNIKAVYGFENKDVPQGSYIINSLDILKP